MKFVTPGRRSTFSKRWIFLIHPRGVVLWPPFVCSWQPGNVWCPHRHSHGVSSRYGAVLSIFFCRAILSTTHPPPSPSWSTKTNGRNEWRAQTTQAHMRTAAIFNTLSPSAGRWRHCPVRRDILRDCILPCFSLLTTHRGGVHTNERVPRPPSRTKLCPSVSPVALCQSRWRAGCLLVC